jgi:hypothetical protein
MKGQDSPAGWPECRATLHCLGHGLAQLLRFVSETVPNPAVRLVQGRGPNESVAEREIEK